MTKISAYPEIAVPTTDDLLIGTDVETQNQTKNFSIQSVIDLVTLQQVTEAGNSTDQPIAVNVNDGIGITASSASGAGIQGYSDNGAGVIGISDLNHGVIGSSVGGYGGYFTSSNGSGGVYAYSESTNAITGETNEGYGVYGYSGESTGVYGSSDNGYGGYFTSDETYSLVAAQSAAKPGGGSWSVFSDSRIKENITPYTKGLAEILLVNTVTYDYNGLAGTTKGAKFTGIIAQEIKEIFPETVKTYKAKLNEEDEEKTELYDFNASDLTFALINAVKELKAEIEILKAK